MTAKNGDAATQLPPQITVATDVVTESTPMLGSDGAVGPESRNVSAHPVTHGVQSTNLAVDCILIVNNNASETSSLRSSGSVNAQLEHGDTTARRSLAPVFGANACANTQPLPPPQAAQKSREKISVSKEKKAAKTLAVIMGVFVLCWLPFFLTYVILPFCDTSCYLHPKVYEAITWLGYINSAINPVIYTIFNMDFRRGFQKLICPRSHQRRQQHTARHTNRR
jgi:hypothetical protein